MNGGSDGQAGKDQQPGWVFKPGEDVTVPPPSTPLEVSSSQQPLAELQPAGGAVEWTASEYVAHQKNIMWYLSLAGIVALIAAITYLVTRDMISTGVVLFGGLVFAVVGARKPRVVAYRVDQSGLTVGQQEFAYSSFKSFAIVRQGSFFTIAFLPLKRFVPSVDINVPPDSADAIIEVLSQNLPLETKETGIIDSLAHKIRF